MTVSFSIDQVTRKMAQKPTPQRKISVRQPRLRIFAGIEGGATRSTTVLVREDGHILAWVDGVTTNYLVSFACANETFARLYVCHTQIAEDAGDG